MTRITNRKLVGDWIMARFIRTTSGAPIRTVVSRIIGFYNVSRAVAGTTPSGLPGERTSFVTLCLRYRITPLDGASMIGGRSSAGADPWCLTLQRRSGSTGIRISVESVAGAGYIRDRAITEVVLVGNQTTDTHKGGRTDCLAAPPAGSPCDAVRRS